MRERERERENVFFNRKFGNSQGDTKFFLHLHSLQCLLRLKGREYWLIYTVPAHEE